MVRSAPVSPSQRARQILWYICAVILPLLATMITVRTPALHGIPFALSFVVIAGLATVSGLGPALVAIAASILSYDFRITPPYHRFSFSKDDLVREFVLVLAASLLTLLVWRQRRAETKLRATLGSLHERTEALSQAQLASELATWLFNSATMTTAWDEGSTEIFGRPFKDLNNAALPMDFIVPEDQDHISEAISSAIATGGPIQFEFRTRWPNGEIHWLEARGTRVHPKSKYWRGVTFDITRRKIVEKALVRSEKLAAMGRLASTVAHEVNNPLESVTNLLYLARIDPTLNSTTHSYLKLAEEELARLANITRLTLSFVRTGGVSGPVEINPVLDNVLAIFLRKCEVLNVTIERDYSPGVQIEIPEHELRQILINLISNAVDALVPGNPRIRLQTIRREETVVLMVEDNGHGIRASDQAHVFDAFFTTKEDVGTGIGLWVTKELVDKNGGHISFESGDLADGFTTRFRIDFPAVAPAALAIEESS